MENQSKHLSQTDKEHLKRCGLYIPTIEHAKVSELNGTKTSLDDAANTENNNNKEATSLPSLLPLPIFPKPFYWIDSYLLRAIRDRLKNLALLEILQLTGNLVGSLSVLMAVIIFIATEQQRRNTEVYQAWQVVNGAYNQSGSGGRREALEFLNSEPRRNPWFWLRWERESLASLAAPKAFLYKIRLPKAYLSGANLEKVDLSESNLQEADLWETNLRGAILTEANLQEANLWGANLQGANLANTDLREAKLESANLKGAKYTDKNTTPEVCKKYLIDKNYPCNTMFPKNVDPKARGMVLMK